MNQVGSIIYKLLTEFEQHGNLEDRAGKKGLSTETTDKGLYVSLRSSEPNG